jgi:digeranylgeranylglycerophospholipid reductase
MPSPVKYDFVIVGASVAGLYAAMKLARNGRSVAVLDRKDRIGVPVRCGEATGNRGELARFVPVDESWIASDLKGISVRIGPAQPFEQPCPDLGVVLHRNIFENALADAAVKAGACLSLNTPITALANGHGRFSGVVSEDGRRWEGGIIIGADGCESRIGRLAGITRELPLDGIFPSAQYQIDTDLHNGSYLHFFLDARVVPRGYAWLFPKGGTRFSVGAGMYGARGGPPKAVQCLDSFIRQEFPSAKKESFIAGCVPIAVCPRDLHRGNVLVLGDAARQANPLSAGGIMNALEAADLAVRELLRGGDAPVRYSAKWRARYRLEQKLFCLLKDILVHSSDTELRGLIGTLGRAAQKHLDRSHPFKVTFSDVQLLLFHFFPKIIRFHRVLWK